MNFGETLTYWYLRLNGFFPLGNFVLHRANIEDRPSADADLLAIRFPNVYEVIGGQSIDWDHRKFESWGLSLSAPLALIVEVKTGPTSGEMRAWRPERLRAALKRFGMFQQSEINDLAEQLQRANSVTHNTWVVAKLLLSRKSRENSLWHNLTLKDADAFIRDRLGKYKHEKNADRMFFPDDLIQYLAWKALTDGDSTS